MLLMLVMLLMLLMLLLFALVIMVTALAPDALAVRPVQIAVFRARRVAVGWLGFCNITLSSAEAATSTQLQGVVQSIYTGEGGEGQAARGACLLGPGPRCTEVPAYRLASEGFARCVCLIPSCPLEEQQKAENNGHV